MMIIVFYFSGMPTIPHQFSWRHREQRSVVAYVGMVGTGQAGQAHLGRYWSHLSARKNGEGLSETGAEYIDI